MYHHAAYTILKSFDWRVAQTFFLTLQSSAVYSSLELTVRKINIRKLVRKRTSVLLVSDVAARGVDISMLANVIKCKLPSKTKLFVNRAGSNDPAISLVSVDKMASMTYICSVDTISGSQGMMGSMGVSLSPYFLRYRYVHTSTFDLAALKKVAENGPKQYLCKNGQILRKEMGK